MFDYEQASVLTVGLGDQTPIGGLNGASYTSVANARQAIEMLRMMRFDLLVTSMTLPDMPVFSFVCKIRTAWPWQKWALVARGLSERDEIVARSMGVMTVLESGVDWDAVGRLAQSVRNRAAITVAINPSAVPAAALRVDGQTHSEPQSATQAG